MFPASVPLGVCLVGGGGKVLGKFWLNKEVSILKGSACLSQDFRDSLGCSLQPMPGQPQGAWWLMSPHPLTVVKRGGLQETPDDLEVSVR